MINKILKRIFRFSSEPHLHCEKIPTENIDWVISNTEWLNNVFERKPRVTSEHLLRVLDASEDLDLDKWLEHSYRDLFLSFKIGKRINVSHRWVSDLRDLEITPVVLHGNLFESNVKCYSRKKYIFFFSESLKRSPKRLLYNVALCFSEVYLNLHDVDNVGTQDKKELLLLTSFYLGIGVYITSGYSLVKTYQNGLNTINERFPPLISESFLSFIVVYLEKKYHMKNIALLEHHTFYRFQKCYEYWSSVYSIKPNKNW